MAARGMEVRSYLPLTPAVLHILLALSNGDRHGYAIAKEVADRTNGETRLGPGTLYGTLSRLLDAGLIDEGTAKSRRPAPADSRRRYYRITDLGRDVVTAEVRRLSDLVVLPSAKALLRSAR